MFGGLAKASQFEQEQRQQEFLDFDNKCREDSIMFVKLLFVTDRDTIAHTLGKRLAHKKIAHDLRVWLDSSTELHNSQISRAGLDEIDMHIDPTDFIAFNSYKNNLKKFVDFAKKTDIDEFARYKNPWLVMNTFLLNFS